MFEVSKTDIKTLDDKQLRELVVRLCRAEAISKGLPVSAVKWGGHQNASDGGADIEVDFYNFSTIKGDYIPELYTIFQCKATDMSPNKITKEMQPQGKHKKLFEEIDSKAGAYIIVSNKSDTAKRALNSRMKAMQDVIGNASFAGIVVDFYDIQRLVDWTNLHMPVIAWVFETLGKPHFGWKPYGNWSNPQENTIERYYVDNETASILHKNEYHTVSEGVQKIREILNEPGTSIRLVGLSGTGKTKLVQALFDDELGSASLPKEKALYCDISDSPEPTPQQMAEHIKRNRDRVILIVDDCSPNLHRGLTKICTDSDSNFSLITVEYDIKEDQPEETAVFKLFPLSDNTVADLIYFRFSNIDGVGARNIAQAAGGNARIAVSIAKSIILNGENAGKLTDNQLFRRLFWQNGAEDDTLLKVAEICALVYSFGVENIPLCKDEMPALALIVNIGENDFYRALQALVEKELAQKRGGWRAVLPHVLANKLAKYALNNNRIANIINVFESTGNERLLVSFAKRIGYLHDDEKAVDIAKQWIAPSGILHNIGEFNAQKETMFFNIASTIPKEIFAFIKHSIDTHPDLLEQKRLSYKFVYLIILLAYESDMFEDCISLLVKIHLSTENTQTDQFLEMFRCWRSGTHATWEQKKKIVSDYLLSPDEKFQATGLKMLQEMFSFESGAAHYSVDFGSHYRDSGYQPKNDADICKWYTQTIEYAFELVSEGKVTYDWVLVQICQNFRALWEWNVAILHDYFLVLINKVREKQLWPEGLACANDVIRYFYENEERIPKIKDYEIGKAKLLDIIICLSPRDEIEEYLLLFGLHNWKLEELGRLSHGHEEQEQKLFSIGVKLGSNLEVLKKVIQPCLNSKLWNAFSLGKGMATGAKNVTALWHVFCENINAVEFGSQSYKIIAGFANGCSEIDTVLCEEILSFVAENENLNRHYLFVLDHIDNSFPFAHAYGFMESTDLDAECYCYIGKEWSEAEITVYFELLKQKRNGNTKAVECFFYEFINTDRSEALPLYLQKLAHKILLSSDFSRQSRDSHIWGRILERCTDIYKDDILFKELAFKILIFEGKINYRDADDKLYGVLATLNPESFLDVIMDIYNNDRFYFHESELLDLIDGDIVINWCDSNQDKIKMVSKLIKPFEYKDEKLLWKKLALHLLFMCADFSEIVGNFYYKIDNWSWSSEEQINSFAKRIELFDILLVDEKDENKRDIISKVRSDYATSIEQRKRSEERYALERKYTTERFEW